MVDRRKIDKGVTMGARNILRSLTLLIMVLLI
jgi:hypothetical protein